MADPRQFLINTDYPLDKVVYIKQGSTVIGTGGTVLIPHGLPFIPNALFIWSFTQDFSVTYPENTGAFPSGNPGFFFTLQVAMVSNATNIKLDANGTLGPTTIYYRIIAFAPSDYTGDLPATTSLGDRFVINTDSNYTKLVSEGILTLNIGNTQSVVHSLGYLPQVIYWYVSGGISYPMGYTNYFFGVNQSWNAILNTTSLTFNNNGFTNGVIHYRLYADD